ncbi:MAG: GTP 3',8-cyclase MoaA [Bacteroidetes bacterium]|nr:GTP 3',8-cyclase MoaA [Bacteroidota bacterium]MBL6943762.1 GTP 3',8-cyclase MoaA [Bacteroidales bacterium]
MYDKFKRKINYLRISITDRCNLRCTYCMPEEGIQLMEHSDIISFEEIVDVVKISVGLGIDKVRITGGEPLVRKGIVDLVAMITKIPGIVDFGLTTNGILLKKYAKGLKEAGLHRVNVSLDTLNPQRYNQITRLGKIEDVLQGIAEAQKVGLTPVKINCVIKKSSQEPDAIEVAEYCRKNNFQIRFIHQMELSMGHFTVVEGGDGGDCSICNRIRLTANGNIKPCLFNNLEYNIRDIGIEEAIAKALKHKPSCGSKNTNGTFYNIGG